MPVFVVRHGGRENRKGKRTGMVVVFVEGVRLWFGGAGGE